jgi:hypothetical protein
MGFDLVLKGGCPKKMPPKKTHSSPSPKGLPNNLSKRWKFKHFRPTPTKGHLLPLWHKSRFQTGGRWSLSPPWPDEPHGAAFEMLDSFKSFLHSRREALQIVPYHAGRCHRLPTFSYASPPSEISALLSKALQPWSNSSQG